MKSGVTRALLCSVLAIFSYASLATATITSEFTSLAAYNTAVGPHTVITFTGFADGTVITTQYAGVGATFSDGNDSIGANGQGLIGNGRIDIAFSSLMNNVGAEFPGALAIDLYLGAALVDTSSNFAGHGTGFFAGVVSSPFNRAVLRDWFDDVVFIDNLHFGNTGVVPEPATLALLGLGLAGLGFGRRKQ